jgi:hypothetical protein
MARRELATVKDYEELMQALYDRAEELRASRSSIDEVAGWPEGYASKLLRKRRVKSFGAKSLGPLLSTLGLKLVVVEDDDAVRKYSSRLRLRRESLVRHQHSAAA